MKTRKSGTPRVMMVDEADRRAIKPRSRPHRRRKRRKKVTTNER
jgi:hypothetical protein